MKVPGWRRCKFSHKSLKMFQHVPMLSENLIVLLNIPWNAFYLWKRENSLVTLVLYWDSPSEFSIEFSN